MQKERKRKRHKNKRREEGGNRKNKTITTLRTWSKFKFELSENSIEQESAYYRFTSLKVKSDGDEIKSNLKIVLNTCIRVRSRSVAWTSPTRSPSFFSSPNQPYISNKNLVIVLLNINARSRVSYNVQNSIKEIIITSITNLKVK